MYSHMSTGLFSIIVCPTEWSSNAKSCYLCTEGDIINDDYEAKRIENRGENRGDLFLHGGLSMHN